MSLIRRKTKEERDAERELARQIITIDGEEYYRLAHAASVLSWSVSKLNKRLREKSIPVHWTKWGEGALNAPVICRAADVERYKRHLDANAKRLERILSPQI